MKSDRECYDDLLKIASTVVDTWKISRESIQLDRAIRQLAKACGIDY